MAPYFDYATAAPLRLEVVTGLKELLELDQLDPGRPFDHAHVLRDLIEDARSSIALLAEVEARRVTFVSSLPEAALTTLSSLSPAGRPIIVSLGERLSLLEHANRLGPIVQLRLDATGRIDLTHLEELCRQYPGTTVIAQHANQEIGSINDFEELSALVAPYENSLLCDETLTIGRTLPRPLGASFRIISSELLGGPLGISAIIGSSASRLQPQLLGGAQERGRRAGLENLLGIVGFGLAAQALTNADLRESESRNAREMISKIESDLCASGLAEAFPTGDALHLDYLRSFVTPGFEASAVAMAMNRRGLAVHAGSACSGEDPLPSPTYRALGYDGLHSLRISVGWKTSASDLEEFAGAISWCRSDLQKLSTTSEI